MQNVILARKIDFFIGLYNGDPVAWGILIGVIAISVGWSMFKNRKEQSANQRNEISADELD